ncbi:2'-5' RNA ligase family protein [Candidatus Poriferisodalis sp.]|uniref:2'-5' RNA ligase family protein n=1 Tax=Candidatus Poriferisodalis sp. TaxID=3101277 RepID=UPI003B01CD06
MPRLFVAVWPPEGVVCELAALPRPKTPGVRWTRPQRMHITLRFLGECDQSEALEALELVSLPAGGVTLGPAVEQLGHGVFMVPAAGIDELAAAVTDATKFIGEPPPDRPFVGHLTVARFKRSQPSFDWPHLDEKFDVTEFFLVEATPWGEYVNVASFPLS